MNLRLFVAAFPPRAVVEFLRDQRDRLRPRLAAPGVRWLPDGQIHVTLRFLGGVEEGEVPALNSRLRRGLENAGPVDLVACAAFGLFPSARRPRVLWAELRGDLDGLRALQQGVDDAVGHWAEKPEGREFLPHLTLARWREGCVRGHELEPKLRRLSDAATGVWCLDEVRLMRSLLGPDGARYEVLERIVLSRPKPTGLQAEGRS